MGRIVQSFDYNQPNASRMSMTYKRNSGGLEAPRNSVEFAPTNHVVQEDIQYSSRMRHNSARMISSAHGTPIRKLIYDEISSRVNTERHVPNVVARLMGMEPLAPEANSTLPMKGRKNDNARNNLLKTVLNEGARDPPTSQNGLPLMKTKMNERIPNGLNQTRSHHPKSTKVEKPQPREHPQEELLQKFKKEFVAWQASMATDQSRKLGLDSHLTLQREHPNFLPGKHNREKVLRVDDSKGKSFDNKKGSRNYITVPNLPFRTEDGAGLQRQQFSGKIFHSYVKNGLALTSGPRKDSGEHRAITMFHDMQGRPTSPTKIIVLKPTSMKCGEIDESFSASSGTTDRECSMRDFLEEVRERLRYEIEGKAWNYVATNAHRSNSSEDSLDENLTDSRQIARHIARKIRESVTRDLSTSLIRSESTKSYRSEKQFIESDSPGFINKDTRKLLTERLKNILKNKSEMNMSSPINMRSQTSLMNKKTKWKPVSDFSNTGKKESSWDDRRATTVSNIHSFTREHVNDHLVDSETLSPRNLVRSFSAPVSKSVFGNIILEDQHLLTGAHLQRKHEVYGQNSPEIRKNKKDVFNFKGKVSNLKQNFNLKGKFFGKKIKPMDVPGKNEFDSIMDLEASSAVNVNLSSVQENYTEVPPSPASMSSSPPDEIYRPCHPSPVSPLEVPFIEDQHSSHTCGDETSHGPVLSEVKPTNEQAETVQCHPVVTEQVAIEGEQAEIIQWQPVVTEPVAVEGTLCMREAAEVEGPSQSFVRDILVTAGLYEGEYFAGPIPICVLEEVEEACNKAGTSNDNDEGCLFYGVGSTLTMQRKLLFDLVNESLPRVAASQLPCLTLKKWDDGVWLRHGKKLLDELWHEIQVLASPAVDEEHSLASIVSYDTKRSTLTCLSEDDINMMGTEMEVEILGDLIDEFVCDIFL